MRNITCSCNRLWMLSLILIGCSGIPEDIPPNDVMPSPQQIEYQKMEFIGFVHFAVNTGWEPLRAVISFSSGDRKAVFLDSES